MGEKSCLLELQLRVGEPERDRLELVDRLTERPPLRRVLDRMLERGFIETAGRPDERRTLYKITPLGRKAALAEAKLLASVIAELLAT